MRTSPSDELASLEEAALLLLLLLLEVLLVLEGPALLEDVTVGFTYTLEIGRVATPEVGCLPI